MRRLGRSIGMGAALSLLVFAGPVDSAAAAPEDPPAKVESGYAEDPRADVAGLPPRKRPTTPAASPAPQSNARARQVTCGQVITQNTVLRNDVGPCPGDGIVIGADNIFVNLNGHRLLGNSDQGASGEFAGIRLAGRTGVTVTGHPGGQASGQMATVSGFEAGVVIDGGSRNTVAKLAVRDNIGVDDVFNAELGDGIILFESAFNHIVNNVVVHNGVFDGIGVLGGDADGNTIEGNTVEDTVGPAPRRAPGRPSMGPSIGGPAGQGIITNAAGMGMNLGQTITGSNVRDNVVRGNGSAGIANVNVTDSEIVGNVVEGNGLTNRFGNGIGMQLAPTSRDSSSRVLIQGNQVHGNGAHGIDVEEYATENRIIDNNAADNNVLGTRFERFFDLFDGNPACDSNAWSGNVWGNGLYAPVCVTSGGTGPPAPTGPEAYDDPSCSDGFDNDEDGLADADDPDCVPPPYEGSNNPRSCTNGLDDDGDRLIDADDPGCQPEGAPGSFQCSDGRDNDEDGLADRDDPDCRDDSVVVSPAIEGPPGSRNCSDGIDNDRDRLIDGDDPDCQGPPPAP